jgi:hypothetical protein
VGVGVGVGCGVEMTSFVTVAMHVTSAPPSFAEALHWSMFTGSVNVIVDPVVTRQM